MSLAAELSRFNRIKKEHLQIFFNYHTNVRKKNIKIKDHTYNEMVIISLTMIRMKEPSHIALVCDTCNLRVALVLYSGRMRLLLSFQFKE